MLKHNSLFEYITLLWKRVGQGKGRTGGVARNILGERWSQKRLHCKRLKLATKLRCAKFIHLLSERPQLTSLTARVAKRIYPRYLVQSLSVILIVSLNVLLRIFSGSSLIICLMLIDVKMKGLYVSHL